jgi:asparagine synthase (glutamine-hydrolysing)
VCGIVGFTHRNRRPPPERIRAATATLKHRGPDQQGVWESGTISLGAVRLKIIDLEAGDQPMTSEDGGTVLAFNGEIYNHKELRRELEQLGHAFRTRGDTETVLRAFLEWDTGCFQRLRGMFAIALWSEPDGRLVLARDRMGIKPLYLSRQGEDLYFGSELKAIFIHPEIERRLDLQGLHDFLSLNYVPGPRTLVSSILKLQPGCVLEWRNGLTESRPYWETSFAPSAGWTLDSAGEALDSLLRQAVRQHLLSDVPLGVWISGGIDSSTILHYAATESASRLKTFSISFQGRSFDETQYIRQAAAHYQTDHHEFDLNPGLDLESAIREFAY